MYRAYLLGEMTSNLTDGIPFGKHFSVFGRKCRGSASLSGGTSVFAEQRRTSLAGVLPGVDHQAIRVIHLIDSALWNGVRIFPGKAGAYAHQLIGPLELIDIRSAQPAQMQLLRPVLLIVLPGEDGEIQNTSAVQQRHGLDEQFPF